jgi:hypothetical protein
MDGRKPDEMEPKRQGDHKSENLRRRVIDEDFETRSWRSDVAPDETGENSLRATPLLWAAALERRTLEAHSQGS